MENQTDIDHGAASLAIQASLPATRDISLQKIAKIEAASRENIAKMEAEVRKMEAEARKMEAEARKMEAASHENIAKMEAEAKKMEAEAKKMEAEAKKMEAEVKKMEAEASLARIQADVYLAHHGLNYPEAPRALALSEALRPALLAMPHVLACNPGPDAQEAANP
ncbi:hypothetical protein MFIFM68171_11180 [Madurella fahalii]|uniref:Uncharacterized protein n=1 Tax=Madurella fahalii TaxID=1157608 RepID=A0ABQ0GTB5_9PEZI